MPPVCTYTVPNLKLLAVLLLLGAAAGTVFWLDSQNTTTPVISGSDVVKADDTSDTATDVETESGETIPDDKIIRDAPAVDNSRSALPQGIKGLVLLPDGSPAVGIAVSLLPNLRSDPLTAFLMTRSGQVMKPLATTTTHSDGSFALGILKPSESVDLRVTSVDHPELSRAPLDVAMDEWHDVGDLTLEQGLVVQGRVVDATTKAVIAHATVYLKPNHNLLATPGRHRGTSMEVAADGTFRFFNAPKTGLIDLVAEADGYAPLRLTRQQLNATAANDFVLKMEQGHPLTGIVVDQQGNAIAHAQVTAQGHSAKTPQREQVYSDDDGRFEFVALAAGPYRLETTAHNHANASTPIALTDEDVKVVMTRRTSVKLRVLARNGRDVKSYRLSLKRSFENGIANVFDYPDRNITQRNYEGQWAIIENVPYGEFCFQLTDSEHAKTLSPSFEVTPNEGDVEVVATLTTGAEITGTVIDSSGNPVAGATVTTPRDGMHGLGKTLFGKLGGLVPEKHQARAAKTDKQGRFRLRALSFADYMVVATHPDFAQANAKKLQLTTEGQVVDAGVLQMERGALVSGTTTKVRVRAGQIDVKITTPPDLIRDAQQNGQAIEHFSVQARSDNNGNFRFLHRLPPGRYWVTASRFDPTNPFTGILDAKETGRDLIIQPGQEQAELTFDLRDR